MNPILQTMITLAGPMIGIWLGVVLAEGKSYRERSWDLKAQSYSAIFGALETMRRSTNRALRAEMNGHERDEADEARDNEDYRTARDELFVRIARESWILPVEVQERVGRLEKQLNQRFDTYFDSLNEGIGALKEAATFLQEFARKDMSTQPRRRWALVPFRRGST